MEKKSTLSDGVKRGDVTIDQCVYCGSLQNLTDEHTIPFGLWGSNILVKGSCEKCNIETSSVEQKILQGNLGRLREFLNAPTRHAKKRGRWNGQVVMYNAEGPTTSLSITEVPPIVVFAQFNYLPLLLSQKTKGSEHKKFDAKFCFLFPHSSGRSVGFSQPKITVNSSWWARFISKIAYCEYIRAIDKDFRSKPLSKFILTGKGDNSNFVGGRSGAPSVGCTSNIVHFALPRCGGGYAILSYVRLLSFLDSPSYLVYLGEIQRGAVVPDHLPKLEVCNLTSFWPTYNDCPPVPEALENLIRPPPH